MSAPIGLSACGVILDITPEEPLPVVEGGTAEGGLTDASDPGDGSTGDGAGEADADADTIIGCKREPNCVRYVFVTTRFFNSLAVQNADTYCNDEAHDSASVAAIRNRKFLAWTSTSAKSAASRHVQGTMAYRLVDDLTTLANDWTDLTNGGIAAPIQRTNTNAVLPSPSFVWTGTAANGSAAASCGDWTKTSPVEGQAGATDQTDAFWTSASLRNCDDTARLYCIEE